MTYNLRQMAEDEVVFRFENDEDKREFWELFIKNSGDRYNNHISNFAKLWECEDGKLYIDNYKYNLTHEYYPTWTEIKERYEMKVKIVKCSDNQWYTKRIGEIYEVDKECNPDYYSLTNGVLVLKSDTIPVSEIRYEIRDSKKIIKSCITSCEHIRDTSVGSWACEKCEHNCGIDKVNQIVLCSWQKESKYMDLKSIAVRFENREQREEIRSVFKDKGFKVLEIMSTEGVIGYADDDVYDYVCSLSTIGLMGKKIISYEEFMGGKEMKRLNIRKDYEDSKLAIKYYESFTNIRVIGKNNEISDIGMNVGDDSNLTLYQANAILKVMGLNYELYEVDWSKVEEGAEVVFWLTCGNLKGQVRGKFNSYIPNLKKIIVIVGDEVKVVDEDKVELC